MKDSEFILHVDGNNFYASIEASLNPDLRGKPIAVCGDPALRHGIVLAKSQEAKIKGVKTAQTISQARLYCPELILVPSDISLYVKYSNRLRRILYEQSDYVEPYGLDEAWVKVWAKDYGEAAAIGDGIRTRIRMELGITASVGVSWNKIFAKLGSDFKKPDATTVISPENYRSTIWTLPAGDLLFVGASNAKKLARIGIQTIGELANGDIGRLTYHMGKNGAMLKAFAQGQDTSPVMGKECATSEKSFSHSTTTPYDIQTADQAKCSLYLLAESVAMRMRDKGFRARCVGITFRTPELKGSTRQRALKFATHSTDVIAKTAVQLFMEHYLKDLPYRGVGLNCTLLEPIDAPTQIDLFGGDRKREKQERLDFVLDDLYRRHGRCIERGVVKYDQGFAKTDIHKHVSPFSAFYTGS